MYDYQVQYSLLCENRTIRLKQCQCVAVEIILPLKEDFQIPRVCG